MIVAMTAGGEEEGLIDAMAAGEDLAAAGKAAGTARLWGRGRCVARAAA